MNFFSKLKDFHWQICIWKCRLPKWRPYCPGLNVLNPVSTSQVRLPRSYLGCSPPRPLWTISTINSLRAWAPSLWTRPRRPSWSSPCPARTSPRWRGRQRNPPSRTGPMCSSRPSWRRSCTPNAMHPSSFPAARNRHCPFPCSTDPRSLTVHYGIRSGRPRHLPG